MGTLFFPPSFSPPCSKTIKLEIKDFKHHEEKHKEWNYWSRFHNIWPEVKIQRLNKYTGTGRPCQVCTKRVMIQWTCKARKVQQQKNGVTGFWSSRSNIFFVKICCSLNTYNIIFRSSPIKSLNCNDSQVRSYENKDT